MFSRRQLIAKTAAVAALLIAAGVPSLSSAAESGPKEFRIGYQKAGISIIARQQKAIDERLKQLGVENVKWVEFQFGPPLLEALGAGAIDIGAVGDAPPIFAQAAGANVTYVAASPASQHAILVRKDSPLQSVADLKGKRVAIPKGSSAHNLTVQALAAKGLSFGDITPVYLSPADAVAAFARGSVDAFAVWDPFFALVELKQNGRALEGSEQGAGKLPPSNSFYLANKEFARKYPAVVKTALEEIGKVTAWSDKNRDKVAEATVAATGLDPAATKRAYDRAVFSLGPVTPEIIAQQQKIADTFFQLGLIPKAIVVKDAVWAPPQT